MQIIGLCHILTIWTVVQFSSKVWICNDAAHNYWRTDRSLFIYYAHYASYTTFPLSDVARGNTHATHFLSLQSRTTLTGGEPLHSYFILVSILTCN